MTDPLAPPADWDRPPTPELGPSCSCGALSREQCGWLALTEDVARVGCHLWAEVGFPVLRVALRP